MIHPEPTFLTKKKKTPSDAIKLFHSGLMKNPHVAASWLLCCPLFIPIFLASSSCYDAPSDISRSTLAVLRIANLFDRGKSC